MNQGVLPTLRMNAWKKEEKQIEIGAVDQRAADLLDERLQGDLRSQRVERKARTLSWL